VTVGFPRRPPGHWYGVGPLHARRTVAGILAAGVCLALLATTPGPALGLPADGAGRVHGKVHWQAGTVHPGTPIAAQGRTPKGGSRVSLQVRVPGGWRTFGTARSSPTGLFAISGSLDWYGTHTIRVATAGRHAFRRSTTATVLPTYTPRGDPADHTFTDADLGVRDSYDPCKTVRYAVNTDDVGPAQLLMVQLGMAQVSAATGIRVRYVGVSHQVPFLTDLTRLPPGQDLLVAWGTRQEVPTFLSTAAVGLGGPVWVRNASDGRGRPVTRILESAVVLDSDAYADPTAYSQSYLSTQPTWGEVILHELGHAFGLDHVQAPDEIMYPDTGAGRYPDGTFRGQYDAGDLAGLATNGLGQGCFGPVRHREAAAPLAAPPPQP